MTHRSDPPASDGAAPQLVLLTGHSEYVRSLAFSPHGDVLASSSANEIILWDAKTGALLLKILDQSGPHVWMYETRVLGWLRDGTTLVSCDRNSVRLWDSRDGALLRTNEPIIVESRLLTPDGCLLILEQEREGQLALWDVERDEIVNRFQYALKAFCSAALSPDGRLLAVGHQREAKILDVPSGDLICTLVLTDEQLKKDRVSRAGMETLTFSPNGDTLASGDILRVRLWNARTGKYITTLNKGAIFPRSRPVFSPDGDVLATGCDNGEILLHRQDGIETIASHRGSVTALAFSPNGAVLASGGLDHSVRIWDSLSRNLATLVGGPDHAAYAVQFSADGGTLVSTHGDNTVRLWDTKTGALKETVNGSELSMAVAAPAGELTGAGEYEKAHIGAWDARTGRSIGAFDGCQPVALSADGRFVAFGEDYWYGHSYPRQYAVWDLWKNVHIRSIAASSDYGTDTDWWPKHILTLALSPDGSLSAVAYDFGLAVWQNDTGDLLWFTRVRGYHAWALAFSPDGAILAAFSAMCDDDMVQFFSVENGQEIGTLDPHPGIRTVRSVTSIAISPEGSRVVTAHKDGTIVLWSYPDSEELVTMTVLQDGSEGGASPEWIACTPDGHYTASAGAEHYIRFREP